MIPDNHIVFDMESDGLLEAATKIHVLSYHKDGEVHSTHDYDEMREVLTGASTLVGHNIIRFDVVLLEKLLDIKIEARLIDTLALSWYLRPDRQRHGLEGYGEDYGIPKPVITDWDSLTPEDYRHRCEEDVKINTRLYKEQVSDLRWLYPDESELDRFVDYLTFKLDCAAEQEKLRWRLDVPKAEALYAEWTALRQEKIDQLVEAMPQVPVYRKVTKPVKVHKADGSLTAYGARWFATLEEAKLPSTTEGPINLVKEWVPANPASNNQVKDWLYSLGWTPATFKFTRDKDGNEKSVEQVRDGSELCSSVTDLIPDHPAVGILDGLTVLNHRLGIVKGFLDKERSGYVVAGINGFTNTLRFRHYKPLVNLPGVDKPYGADIRGCLIAPEGYVLSGADMVSLEDTTKRHYMQPLDPDYVEEMSKDGFDPHLDLAKHAGAITQADIDMHNSGEKPLGALRKAYKVVNYSSTYGIGAKALSRSTGFSVSQCTSMLDAFWKRNWAVEAVAKGLKVRERYSQMWVQNPVSGFWYSLRSDKDRFSTLNQGTGVYCFDSWVKLCRDKGIKTIGQFHDEIIALVPVGDEGKTEQLMKEAADELNDQLKLNVDLGVDVQFGNNYAEIH